MNQVEYNWSCICFTVSTIAYFVCDALVLMMCTRAVLIRILLVTMATMSDAPAKAVVETATKPPERRRKPMRIIKQMVPDEILHNEALNNAIKVLNQNYEFEIHKTVWRIKKNGLKRIALQFPEGLLMYACAIADIFEKFAGAEHIVILGDVTYGACCVDDFSAKAMKSPYQCELLIHYGHSCLIPVDETSIPCMYVFVNMKIDLQHLIESVKLTFSPDTRLILAGTIQFNKEMHAAKKSFKEYFQSVVVPQCKPLSSGEVLGCTAPCVEGQGDVIVFIADGRFHLEALMIANPDIPAYRYDPYGRVLTLEKYDHKDMRRVRRQAVEAASKAKSFGVILGTLGRQGSPKVLGRLEALLKEKNIPYMIVLMSEVSPAKLKGFSNVEAWIQVACPRLSIDWGEGFHLPVLTPYEGMVALNATEPWWNKEKQNYAMDYYSTAAGPWGNKYKG